MRRRKRPSRRSAAERRGGQSPGPAARSGHVCLFPTSYSMPPPCDVVVCYASLPAVLPTTRGCALYSAAEDDEHSLSYLKQASFEKTIKTSPYR